MNEYFKLYWKKTERHPYILKCNGELAGFMLERLNENVTIFDIKEKATTELNIKTGILQEECQLQIEKARKK